MKLIITSVLVCLLISGTGRAQNKQVRDSNSRLVETWSQRGNTTDVRGRDGTLLETRTQRGNRIAVRDRNGRLLKFEHEEE
jgi:YD repeat-containing protein